MTTRLWPQGYWPAAMTDKDRENSLANFSREIYPLWKGIEKNDIDADLKLSMEQIQKLPILSEVITTHKQDLAIYDSGIKPMRISMTPESAQDMRRKAAASDRFSAWKQNA